MNIETGTPNKSFGKALQPCRYAEPQLSLPLEADPRNEYSLHAAWLRSGLQIPFHAALRIRPLAISLGCLAEAMRRKAQMNNRCVESECRSNQEEQAAMLFQSP
jgi:hypothetical protein